VTVDPLTDRSREDRLRETTAGQGLALETSPRRDLEVSTRRTFRLTARGAPVAGNPATGFGLTLAAVEQILTRDRTDHTSGQPSRDDS